jgi:nucleoside-diphosphate-sugar epimerase
MTRLLTWGAGQLGGRVARLWRDHGEPVLAFTQTEKRHAELAGWGIEPYLGSPARLLQPDDALLLALPGHEQQLAAVTALCSLPPPARLVLLSSTGYYGPASGRISEDTPAGPGQRPAAIAATEQAFLAWAGGRGVVIRLAGLYHSSRGPFNILAKGGTPRLGPPDKILSLIHYDDAARATLAALRHPDPAAIYLAVTPPCPTRQEFYRLACPRLQREAPVFSTPLNQPPAFFEVTRLRRDLLPQPAYPDWRAALPP